MMYTCHGIAACYTLPSEALLRQARVVYLHALPIPEPLHSRHAWRVTFHTYHPFPLRQLAYCYRRFIQCKSPGHTGAQKAELRSPDRNMIYRARPQM